MEEAREARRKKIVNRGGDRLAFITGQTRSLPEGSDPPPPTPAGAFQPQKDVAGILTAKIQASDHIFETQNETSDEIARYNASTESSAHDANNHGGTVSPATSDQVSSRAPSTAQKTSCIPFTPSQLSASISASEDTRLICSIVIAFWVVLSYHGYSLGIRALGNIVSYRPLLLVLLTDVTIILGPLVLGKANTARSPGKEGSGWTTNIGGMLEAAMLMQKALAAVTLDCSLCAVIIVCFA